MADRASATAGRPRSSEEWEEWMMWDEADREVPRSTLNQAIPKEVEAVNTSRKRKTRADEQAESHTPSEVPDKKPTVPFRSHNIVERRYRNNINTKIADLRDSVPSLKVDPDYSLQQTHIADTAAQKLNKATILTTAVSYIHDLQRDKKRLEVELCDIKARLRAMEQRVRERETTPENKSPCCTTTPDSVSPSAPHETFTSSPWENPAEGMIQLPDDIRRFRTATIQAQHAEQPYLACEQDHNSASNCIEIGPSGGRRVRQIGKFVAGTFAGLMVAQGLGGDSSEEGRHSKRSVSVTPDHAPWLASWQVSVAHSLHLSYHRTRYAILAAEVFLCLFVFGFSVFLYAFCYKPKRRRQDAPQRVVPVPSLASPLEVRRNAWLTSIQIVRVPRHSMFPEWVAVNLEALHYVVRHFVGWHGYSWMTRSSEDDEIARVRAWDIAIDAQLMGGDAEISGSRLILTILASGTLPTTPSRLILKALHLRILLWKASKDGKGTVRSLMHRAAALLAAHQWRLAQELQRAVPQTGTQPRDGTENLPEHLTALLQLSCSEVLTDPTIQRAYNLAWSRPTQEDVTHTDAEMDLVVEDSTIRSPLDALCAWLSSSTLQKALIASLDDTKSNASELEWNFGVALHTAPQASIAQARALAANAVFVDANRQSALSMLSHDFPSTAVPGPTITPNNISNSAIFIDSSMPEAVGYDVTLATYCALALSKLENLAEEPQVIEEALELVSLGYQNVDSLTWLSFATAHRLIQTLMLNRAYKQYGSLVVHVIPRLASWAKSSREELGGHGCNSKPVLENAVNKTTAYMTESNENLCVSNEHSVASSAMCAGEISEAVAAKESAADGGMALLPERVKDRRSSRASSDSGYGSGEA